MFDFPAFWLKRKAEFGGHSHLYQDLSEGKKLDKRKYYINLSFNHQGSRFYAKWHSDRRMLKSRR